MGAQSDLSTNEANFKKLEDFLTVPVKINGIINELDNKEVLEHKLVPIEVQLPLLSSNNIVPSCTSLGGNLETEFDIKSLNFSDKTNLTNLFSLLLKIDKRNNPNLYKNNYESNNIGS